MRPEAWRGVVLVLALTTAATTAAAQGTTSPWVGKKVVTKREGALRVGKAIVDNDFVHRVYTVERVNGDWLWLVSGSVAGWTRSGEVVPFDQALDYYTQLTRTDQAAWAYAMRGMIWLDRNEPDIAIGDLNEALRLDPSQSFVWNNRGLAWSDKKDYDRAIADYNEAIRLDPKYANAYNVRAWLWATCPNGTYRDGKKAVESATRACELTGWKDASALDTLAAACAESGDFDKAVEDQEKANSLCTDPEDRTKGEARLKLYKDRKPYREEP